MGLELVLCITGLLSVTGWIPGEGLGCKVTRPTVDQDAMHTVHYNHRRSSNDILLRESIRRYAVLHSSKTLRTQLCHVQDVFYVIASPGSRLCAKVYIMNIMKIGRKSYYKLSFTVQS